MKSPFPGMDPYLESHWRDVHAALIVYIRDQLQGQIGGTLRARVEERPVVEDEGVVLRSINPDARIFDSRWTARQGKPLSGGATVEPLVIPVMDEEATETFIEILDRASGDRLVTVIEILSPANKIGTQSREKYQQKQAEIRRAGVNLVEIDLTRAGRRRLAVHPIPRSHRTTFQSLIYRAHGARPQFEIYPMPLERPLPKIPVPLRAGDADAEIDLQPLVERAYENGAYDDIDYSKPPSPPLHGSDADWAQLLLKKS